MTSADPRRASLAELREMRTGVRFGAAMEDNLLSAEFSDSAELESPARKSVHPRVDAEGFDFFKQGGKGHLTRMQNVLAAMCAPRSIDESASRGLRRAARAALF